MKPRRPRRTQEERSSETTERLVAAAMVVFGERGFAKTSIEDLNNATQMTRGALYHHFDDKADLFRAAFTRMEVELVARIQAAAARHRDPWAAFHAGCVAFLEACVEPAVQRIILLDGPAVLGSDVIRSIESATTLALLEEGIRRAIEGGALPKRPVAPLARMLLGALSESAKHIAHSTNQATTLRDAKAELNRILEALARG